MSQTIKGTITVRDGKQTGVKNLSQSDPAFALVPNEDLARTLKKLFDAGWRLEGDYELTISKKTQ